ncbi:BTAD domain-containing putative transcriptional regulator [Hamadaea sp. NPDC051192]|uniref:AfsR/SARP family transcriptional regulator n=1 Tax=Hamadaea sp. NPDC051192 TaxID=3154940 RepID=UPI00343D280F
MDFRILGRMDVRSSGAAIDVRQPQTKLVLGLLLLEANRMVPTSSIVDALWAQAPPATAKAIIQNRIAELRRLLAESSATIITHHGGYALSADVRSIDVWVFKDQMEQARRESDARVRVKLLDGALGLWRGPLLADVAAGADGYAPALEEARLAAEECRAEALLSLGEHEPVVHRLLGLVADHPARERLVASLMTALARAGRLGEALEVYRRTWRWLDAELGIRPGRDLAELHDRLLTTNADAPAVPTVSVPAQLPRDLKAFAGRADALACLDEALATAQIVVVSGTAGVGKTALTVHWAHRVKDHFPDGQLYVNLQGFDHTQVPMRPEQALRQLLSALAAHLPLPGDYEAQRRRYHDILHGRRVLIVLDNAAGADQVRPLLPPASGCLVIVTSRYQLPSLVVTESAHPVELDVLPAPEARLLLTYRLGRKRVDAELDAVDDIVARCARLPLALAVAAARAATYPAFSLRTLAEDLSDNLSALSGGEHDTDIRAVLATSYRVLSADAARLFRLVGTHCGADFTLWAAASAGGLPVRAARPLLAELTRTHMIIETRLGRYTMHDLLRSYARELCDGPQPDVMRRLLDYRLRSALAADRSLLADRYQVELTPQLDSVTSESFAGLTQAVEWLNAERTSLVSAVTWAADNGFDAYAWQLAWALRTFLEWRGHTPDSLEAMNAAFSSADRLGDATAKLHLHRALAIAAQRLGDGTTASAHAEHALRLAPTVDDLGMLVRTHRDVARFFEDADRLEEAFRHAQQALDAARAGADDYIAGRMLNMVGWFHSALGRHDIALIYCRQSLDMLGETGRETQRACTLDSIGFALHGLGDYAEAAAYYERAADLNHTIGDLHTAASVLVNLGNTYEASGDLASAHNAWHRAAAIFDELRDTRSTEVRDQIARFR